MKRIISTALAALLLVAAPMAAFAQAESGQAGMEQPTGKKHHKGHKSSGKKGKKKAKDKAPEGETK